MFGPLTHSAENPSKAPDATPRNATAPMGTLVLPAEVVAYQSALLTAKVAGYLKRIPVDKGDKVKTGELIADIEVPELLADRVQYTAQVDVARREYERMQQAAKTAPDLVTPDNLDNARGKFEVARAQLDRVNVLLNYARITAPFSGTITARYVDPGAFIPVPSQSSQQSAGIVTLMDFSHVRIQMFVPENDAYQVRPGCKAVFTAVGLPDKRFTAAITRVSYALDRNVRTMLAEIDMLNPNGLLQPGMYLSVQLTPAPPEAAPANGIPKAYPKSAKPDAAAVR
ncbi:MAG TPA: efflux RND transporter periplasmic adaptor subunit [Steroidobacteraceae bacterium]|nr:efflux RND transporter periplasmic adaptor subunit [Steroidobacteraceae bacterium]